MLGLKGTYESIRTANGPAQHVACALVGLTYAGMFLEMVPFPIVALWAMSSVIVMVAVVWLPKIILKTALLADFILSCMVLSFYLFHEPEPKGFTYYSMGANGITSHSPDMHSMSTVEVLSHTSAVVLMAAWTLYLSNLVHRQMLEKKRFEVVFEGEVLK